MPSPHCTMYVWISMKVLHATRERERDQRKKTPPLPANFGQLYSLHAFASRSLPFHATDGCPTWRAMATCTHQSRKHSCLDVWSTTTRPSSILQSSWGYLLWTLCQSHHCRLGHPMYPIAGWCLPRGSTISSDLQHCHETHWSTPIPHITVQATSGLKHFYASINRLMFHRDACKLLGLPPLAWSHWYMYSE